MHKILDMDMIHTLSGILLFEGISHTYLEALSHILVDKTYPKGYVVFEEGEEGVGFYVCLTGRVKIYKVSPDGKEQILHVFGEKEPFGEAPVFAGQHYPAFAETLTPARLLFFPRAEFLALVSQDPSLALAMLAVLSRRLRQLTALVENLSLKEVPGRLAAHFIQLRANQPCGAPEDVVTLEMNKGQLSNLLGSTPETFSRILNRMVQEGLIQPLDNRRIRVLDWDIVQKIAEGACHLA